MNIDKEKLKAAAERAIAINPLGGNGNPHPAIAMFAADVLALLAEIERLSPPAGQVSYQEQMEAWKTASSQDLRARGELMIQVEELEADNEALRKDAERYRWLRDPDGQEDLGSNYNMPPIICGYAEHEDILAMDALDRAIDTGIEELKP